MRRPWLPHLLIAAASGLLVATGARHLAEARRALVQVSRDAEQAGHDLAEISQLRRRIPRVEGHRRPERDVIAKVNGVLADARIPADRFQGLTLERDGSITDPGGHGPDADEPQAYRQQSLRLSLEALSPAELGRFIARWQQTQRIWTLERIELSHRRGRSADTNRYDVTVIMTAVYVAGG